MKTKLMKYGSPKGMYSRVVLSLCLTGAAGACGKDASESSSVASELRRLQKDGQWERTVEPVRVVATIEHEKDVFSATAVDLKRHAEKASEDGVWYAADGERYQALLVRADGTSYGRKGEGAPRLSHGAVALEPSFGPSVAPSKTVEAPFDSIQKERIRTDTSIDDRSRIAFSFFLRTFPNRVIGALSGNGDTSMGGCTGAKVGPRHVLTAAHCVMNSNGSITTSGWFNPGQTATNATNGSIRWQGVYLRDWRVSRDYDYALLYLSDTADVASTGYMGMAYWNSASGYDGRSATLRGYPCGPSRGCGSISSQRCAASPRSDKRCDGWMYTHTRTMDESTMSGNQLRIDNDGSSGQSGSPIYGSVNGQNGWIFGVYWGSNSNDDNRGVRVRSSLANDICNWIAQYPSSHVEHPSCN